MPLKAGGLGIDVLANPDHVAGAAMSPAVAALRTPALGVDVIGGWLYDGGYWWLVDAANNMLDPGALEDPFIPGRRTLWAYVATTRRCRWVHTYEYKYSCASLLLLLIHACACLS